MRHRILPGRIGPVADVAAAHPADVEQGELELGGRLHEVTERAGAHAHPDHAIHAADGSPMAVATERDMAIAAVVQHEMMPALVH